MITKKVRSNKKKSVQLNVGKIAKEQMKKVTVTVKLKGLNVVKFRLWLATLFFKAGCWIAGVNYKEK